MNPFLMNKERGMQPSLYYKEKSKSVVECTVHPIYNSLYQLRCVNPNGITCTVTVF